MGLPFLANLGVPPDKQALSPTAADFPKALNPNCRSEWIDAIKDLQPSEDAAFDWASALRTYVKLCVKRNQFPFSNTKSSRNDLIIQNLTNARRQVVRFMNLSKIMDMVTIRKTRREVLMTSNGFTVTVFGEGAVTDPTFSQWLLKMPYPGFRIKHDGQWIKSLGRGITMVVYNDGAQGSQRWHIGYEIAVQVFPDIPGHHLASKAELERFVLDILWLPILKSHRPFKYHRRLI